MKISFNILNGQSVKEKKAIMAAMQRVFDSGYYVLGPEVKKFEESFARYIGVKHAIGVGNGLEALQISLMALGIGPGDEVITTSLSAAATALAIKAVGAKVVFADIDSFYHLDPADVERKISKRTKAVIPVHLYGQPIDMKGLMDLAKRRNIHVVEDCAQAHGAVYGDKKVGSFGIFGCFSFYPTKNLGCIGEGGLITTNDDMLAEKCRMLRNYGQKKRYEHELTGLNSRLDELQAAILSEKLPYLDDGNDRRKEIAAMYTKGLSGISGLKTPASRTKTQSVWHLYVIDVEKRDELQTFLKEKGVETLIHYPVPIHKQKCFSEYKTSALPATDQKVSHILSLPIHPYLKDEEVKYVIEAIKAFGVSFSRNNA